MASPNTKVMPKSGFTTPQFYIGLLAVVGTFLLGQFGSQIGLNGLSDTLQKVLRDQTNLVVGAIVVALVAGFIAFSSWIETNTVRKNGVGDKGKPATKLVRPFYQTSEFWLGLITVVLNYLHDTGVFAPDVHQSTDTATLMIALVYAFARAQLKQAYANAQAQGN